jgi:hypothetical protein
MRTTTQVPRGFARHPMEVEHQANRRKVLRILVYLLADFRTVKPDDVLPVSLDLVDG